MKYLKKYEDIFDEHKKGREDALKFNKENNIIEGYYIVLDFKENYWRIGYTSPTKDLRDFIDNNIGQICEIFGPNSDTFYIKYKNIPNEIKNHFFGDIFTINRNYIGKSINIIDIAKNKSELEYIFTSKKYNL